jgi:uncharacterized RDD family membrane protein YckC
MKCPKCGYLGFETSDRCRNCGYDFSLLSSPEAAFDLPVDQTDEPLIPSPDSGLKARPSLDLDRIIGESAVTPADLPLFGPPSSAETSQWSVSPKQLDAGHKGRSTDRDEPLIRTASRPRTPLSVRRATPEIARARIRASRASDETLFGISEPSAASGEEMTANIGDPPATPVSRITAAAIDAALLFALDGAVLYFTLRLVGLTSSEILQLPVVPLVAFFLLLNGGYFIAFTAVGGQSIGKMAVGIKVTTQDDSSVPIGRAALRTLAYLASALPLGAGFLPGILTTDRLALHDRLAHTRVTRPSSP